MPTTDVEKIVQTVHATRKYRSVCPDTVRQIAEVELAKRGGFRAASKAVKSRLHQIYSAFESGIDYDVTYRRLAAAFAADKPAVKAACREVLRLHSSTQERLPILDEFYTEIWAVTGLPGTLLDLGCGLNPLALPWMGLPPGARYHAFDIDGPRIDFLNRFFPLAGLPPLAAWQDVLCRRPEIEADTALLLKVSSTLERQGKGNTLSLMGSLNVPFVVVSYAVRSLGGREKGMAAHYEREFLSLIDGQPWQTHKLTFETELVFVVEK